MQANSDERRRRVPEDPRQVLSGPAGLRWRHCIEHFQLPAVAEGAELGTGEAKLWFWLCDELPPFPQGEWCDWGVGQGSIQLQPVKRELDENGEPTTHVKAEKVQVAAVVVKQELADEPTAPAAPANKMAVKQEPSCSPSPPVTPRTSRPRKRADFDRSLSPPCPAKAVKREAQPTLSALEIEKCLLRGTIPETLAKQQMSYSQLLRAFLCIAKLHYGDSWPSKSGIILGSSEQYTQALQHQQKAPLLACILQSNSHWALLMASPTRAVLYDGKQDRVIFDQAEALLYHLCEAGFLSAEVKLEKGKVTKQRDNWACGHLATLFFERLTLSLEDC